MARSNQYTSDYAPFEDDYRGFELREDEAARGPLILALAIGVLLVFGAVVWNTYRQGVRTDERGVPSVIAETPDYKQQPLEKGGVRVPDTDKRFYDQIDASNRPTNGQEGEEDRLQGGPPIELRPDQNESRSTAQTGPTVSAVAERQIEDLAGLNAGSDELIGSISASASPKYTPEAAPEIAPQVADHAFSSTGTYFVQMAAFRSEKAAEEAWKASLSNHPDIFRGATREIQRADLGAKGVFYRLRVGSFDGRSEASEYCDAIKKVGQNCIVVSN